MSRIVIKGQKEVEKQLVQLSNPEKLFDRDVRSVATTSLRKILETTPADTGNTRRNWTNIAKVSLSFYRIFNKVRTADKKHLLVNILDKGRGVVRPKRPGGKLYIPLNNKGKSKGLGKKIPSNLTFGKDFVLADKAGPFPGTKFLTKAIAKAENDLLTRVLRRIEAT